MEKVEKYQVPKDNEKEVIVPFKCNSCGLAEHCHYFGKTPNFVKKQVAFFEDTYVMKDPFTPRLQGKANFLMIGGVCHSCCCQVSNF
jgi:Cysteine-rich domain